MSTIELLKAGGIVSIPLLVFSVITIALIIERFWFWLRIKSRERVLVKEVLKIYPSDCVTVINKLRKNLDLPIARIFLESLELENANATEFRLALETATQAELPLLKRFNTFSNSHYCCTIARITRHNIRFNSIFCFPRFGQYRRHKHRRSYRGYQ